MRRKLIPFVLVLGMLAALMLSADETTRTRGRGRGMPTAIQTLTNPSTAEALRNPSDQVVLTDPSG